MSKPPLDPNRLPTSEDKAGKCPRCGFTVGFQLVTYHDMRIVSSSHPPPGAQPIAPFRVVEKLTVLKCMNCNEECVVIEAEPATSVGLRPVQYYPTDHLGDLERIAGVPPKVVTAYTEGVRCLSVRSPKAAVALFRTTIAQIVEDKGSATAKAEKDLFHRIDKMAQEGTLFASFGQWAHHVRSTGNAGAHGEKFDPVTMEQATELRQFVRELINFLYEQPARLAAAMPPTKPAPGSGQA